MGDYGIIFGKRGFRMYRGISAIKLDTKGRLTIPTRYRESLQNQCEYQLIITIDTEVNCLLLYPLPEWEVIEIKLQTLPSFNAIARRIQRLLIGHATELNMDLNGRILIPPLLREYAALKKTVMLVGQGKKFEIWDEENWHQGRKIWLAGELKADEELPEEMKSMSL